MKKYFKFEESPYHESSYTIRINFELLDMGSTNKSFNYIFGKIMGLDYADYLRMCRDVYGAEIIGKNSMYPVAYFKDSIKCQELINEMNQRVDSILKFEK